MSLKEDLIELSNAVPALRQQASDTVGRAHVLADAAAALLHDVTTARDEVSSFLDSTRKAMPAFKAAVEAMEKRQEEAADFADQAWSEANDAIVTAEHGFHDAGEHLATAQAELLHGVFAAANRVEQASSNGADVLQRLGAAANEGAGKVHAAAAAATKEVDGLHEELTHAKQAVIEAEQALRQRIRQLADTVKADAEGMVEKLRQRFEQHKPKVQTPLSNMALSDMESGWEDRLKDAVSTPVAQAEEGVRTALDELAKEAEQRETAVRQAQEEQEGALVELEQTAHRLPDGIRQIQEAMAKLQ